MTRKRKSAKKTTNTTKRKGKGPRARAKEFKQNRIDPLLDQAQPLLQDGVTLVKGADKARKGGPRRFVKNLYDQKREGGFKKKLNITEAVEQAVGTDSVLLAKRLKNKSEDVKNFFSRSEPENKRSKETPGTWSNPNYLVSPYNPNEGESMPRGSGGGGPSDPTSNHPSAQYSNASSVPINPFNDTPTVSQPIYLNSYMDEIYQLSPYEPQEVLNVDGDVTSRIRTHINIIETSAHKLFEFEGDERMGGAYQRVFQEIRQELVSAVNSNTFTDRVMTKANYTQYLKDVCESWALLCELKHRIAFESSYSEQNLVLRGISSAMNIPDMLIAIDKLETVLKKFALPVKLIEYYKWLFQVYRTSPVEGGKQYINMSPFVAAAVKETGQPNFGNWNELIAKINYQTALLWSKATFSTSTGVEIGKWFDLSQYLVANTTTGQFTDIGNCLTYCTEPHYDVDANAIWDNSLSYWSDNNNDPIFKFSKTLREDAWIAMPHNKDSVPAFITAHMMLLYALMNFSTTGTTPKDGTTGGFPFWANYMRDCASIPSTQRPQSQFAGNKGILETSNQSPGMWLWNDVDSPVDYVTDHIWSRANTSNGVGYGFSNTRGLNVRYYSTSNTNAATAGVNFFYDTFNVPLDFG